MKVLIIGAGMGGLCLAHGLRRAGIEFEVFERNTESIDGLPGFGIHLNRNGYGALRDCLPEENWHMFDTMAGNAGNLADSMTRTSISSRYRARAQTAYADQ